MSARLRAGHFVAAIVKQRRAHSGRTDVDAQQHGRLRACHDRNDSRRRLEFVHHVVEHAAHFTVLRTTAMKSRMSSSVVSNDAISRTSEISSFQTSKKYFF